MSSMFYVGFASDGTPFVFEPTWYRRSGITEEVYSKIKVLIEKQLSEIPLETRMKMSEERSQWCKYLGPGVCDDHDMSEMTFCVKCRSDIYFTGPSKRTCDKEPKIQEVVNKTVDSIFEVLR